MSTEPLRFSLARKTQPIEFEQEDGVIIRCTMREMDGNQRDGYLNTIPSRVRTMPDGKPGGMRDFKGIHSSLLCRCLYDADGKLIDEATIQKYPATLTEQLFRLAQEMNNLDNGDNTPEETAKND